MIRPLPAWTVPNQGTLPAFVLGGGPSLAEAPVALLEAAKHNGFRNFLLIAVNDAYRLAPHADALIFLDRKWLDWNRDNLENTYRGRWIVTAGLDYIETGGLHILKLKKKPWPFSFDADTLTGNNSGHAGLNLAALFGGNPIILFGFDLKARNHHTNWHDFHKIKTPPDRYQLAFLPPFFEASEMIRRRGIRVFNASPDSALTCFPPIDYPTALRYAGIHQTK